MDRSLNKVFDSTGKPIAEAVESLGHVNLSNPQELRRIGGALLELADALDPFGSYLWKDSEAEAKGEYDDVHLAVVARAVYLLRRRRKAYLADDLFAEPGWDMLLDLFVDTVAGKRVSTKSLCSAADVPVSTALRWISILEGKGLVRRWTPPDDHRLTAVQMTSAGYENMRKMLSDWLYSSKQNLYKVRREII